MKQRVNIEVKAVIANGKAFDKSELKEIKIETDFGTTCQFTDIEAKEIRIHGTKKLMIRVNEAKTWLDGEFMPLNNMMASDVDIFFQHVARCERATFYFDNDKSIGIQRVFEFSILSSDRKYGVHEVSGEHSCSVCKGKIEMCPKGKDCLSDLRVVHTA